MALFNLNLLDLGAKASKGTWMSNSSSQDPFEDAWIKSSILQEDDLLRQHVERRFQSKYLKVVLKSKNEEEESRAWYGFYHWLTLPETSRKPFQIPEDEADIIIDSLRYTVLNFLNANKQQKETNAK